MKPSSLMDRIEITPSCWLWRGSIRKDGYGQVTWNGRNRKAHQVVWEVFRGPVHPGFELDHQCNTRICVNPDHLEETTHRINTLRGDTITGRNARKTHCIKGHEFSLENTLIRRSGRRECRTCHRERMRAIRAAKH